MDEIEYTPEQKARIARARGKTAKIVAIVAFIAAALRLLEVLMNMHHH